MFSNLFICVFFFFYTHRKFFFKPENQVLFWSGKTCSWRFGSSITPVALRGNSGLNTAIKGSFRSDLSYFCEYFHVKIDFTNYLRALHDNKVWCVAIAKIVCIMLHCEH